MQDTYQFIGEEATFNIKNAENYSYLYFPVAGEAGIKSEVTPNLSGDCKIDQNTFILEPVSAENLHNNRKRPSVSAILEGRYPEESSDCTLCQALLWECIVSGSTDAFLQKLYRLPAAVPL